MKSNAGGAPARRKKTKKPGRGLRVAAILLGIALLLECLYCFIVFTNNPTIRGFLQSLWKKVTGWFTWRKRTDDKEVS